MDSLNKIKKLSIIIPTLNEAKSLPLLLADINRFPIKNKLPSWSFFYIKPNYDSSTNLRKNIG